MAKFKAYPEYKDSGVEWVTSIPSHWNVKPTFSCCDASTIKNTDGLEYNVLSLSYGKIVSRDIDSNYGLLPDSFNTYQLVNKGDTILRLTDLQNDKKSLRVGFVTQQGIITSAYLKLSPRKNLTSYYLYQILHSYDTMKVFYGMGNGLRQSMKFEEFRRLPILMPMLNEQNIIIRFLKHKTTKIDRLIKKQQQLIELLKEKRQALISHAVTKGLNPDVPMKDSGVEWLGNVPEHWLVCPIKHILSIPITDGPHETPDFFDEGIPFISAEAISTGKIDFDKKRAYISKKDHNRYCEKYAPKINDIYMVKSGATTGVTALVETDEVFNIWSPLAAFRCKDNYIPNYVLNFFRTAEYLNILALSWTFGTQQNIGMGILKNIHITCPPIDEAKEIAAHLHNHCLKLEEMLTLALKQVTLLKERRTALISAAVTGKIDLRDWTPPASSTEASLIADEATA